MSTKQTSTNNYSPAGSAAYGQVTPQAANVMSQYMQNPLASSFFQQMLGMSNASTAQQGQTGMYGLTRGYAAGGGGGANPYLQSLQAQQGRATSQQMAGNFGGLLQNSVGNQLQATNMASQFRPLQTGQTQQTTGLGTWLPQLVGAALGTATGFATGGASKAIGSGVGATLGAGGANLSPFLGNGFGNGVSGGYGGGASQNMMPLMPPMQQ